MDEMSINFQETGQIIKWRSHTYYITCYRRLRQSAVVGNRSLSLDGQGDLTRSGVSQQVEGRFRSQGVVEERSDEITQPLTKNVP